MKAEDVAKAVQEAMATSHVVMRAKKAVSDVLLHQEEKRVKSKKWKGDKATVASVLEELGWARQLRLEAYSAVRRCAPNKSLIDADELDAVASAREAWNRSVDEELRHMGNDTARFLFDSDDLVEAVGRLASGSQRARATWGLVKVQLRTPAISDLQSLFDELHPSKRQYGLDDVFSKQASRFAEEWHALGRRCLDRGHPPLARAYARRGVPPALRPAVWRSLLGLPADTSRSERDYYAKLRSRVEAAPLVTDDLRRLDVQRLADHDYYFPFEETLEHLILAFSRDDDAWGDATDGTKSRTPLPPSRGFVSYAAPLTFLFEQEEPIYFALRAMYAEYWAKLNVIATRPETLVPLVKLFEQLLADHHPTLVFHLRSIRVQPAAIAMPWLQFAFVSLLDVEQVLLLWDRILGFDSLLLLPVLAAAIFLFRSEQLLAATTADDVNDMFADCSLLPVVPLLQHFLWGQQPAPAAPA